MTWLLIAAIIVVACFALVLLRGAPYLPTLAPQVTAALDLVNLKQGETLLELGCGDGKVLVAAAQRGISAVGYELNPIMAAVAWLRTRPYRKQVQVVCGDFWTAQWPPAEGIFVFLLDPFMQKLDKKVAQYSDSPVKLVSFAFKIPGKKPARVQGGLYLYKYGGRGSRPSTK